MELVTIDMERTEAARRFQEYRASVRERHDAEAEQIMRGYQALAKGQSVIDLAATIRAGGGAAIPGWPRNSNPMWVPRLAVMRADQPWCRVATYRDGSVHFHHEGYPKINERRNLIKLPPGTLPWPEHTQGYRWGAQAMVPPVPPGLRPKHALGNYHVLFEAEWKPVAPKDPALLRHLGGDLYAVVATWDLTELERCVLARRFQ